MIITKTYVNRSELKCNKRNERKPNQREIRIENGAVGKFGVNKNKKSLIGVGGKMINRWPLTQHGFLITHRHRDRD